jgi:sucrose phosphorylase
MHSILSGSAEVLSAWAADLQTPAPQATYFNFTASHDGIGLMPARGLLSEREVQSLVDTALARGGRASYKTNADGSRSVYELNISYFDALSDPAADEPQSVQVARFVASQAIMLGLAGLPGIYVHSLLGSRSWQAGVERTGHNRAINREKLDRATVEEELADPTSLRYHVFAAYTRLLRARASSAAFHPYGGQRVLDLNPHVFALLRSSPEGEEHALCLHNVSDQKLSVDLGPVAADMPAGDWYDLQEGGSTAVPLRVEKSGSSVELEPYAVRWLGS